MPQSRALRALVATHVVGDLVDMRDTFVASRRAPSRTYISIRPLNRVNLLGADKYFVDANRLITGMSTLSS